MLSLFYIWFAFMVILQSCINFIHSNLCIQSWNLTFYNNDSQNTLKEVAFALKCVLLTYHFWFSFRPSNQHLHSPLSVKITGISSHFCPLLTSSFLCTLNSFKQSWSMVRCQNIFFSSVVMCPQTRPEPPLDQTQTLTHKWIIIT